jgi:hypothetical protein
VDEDDLRRLTKRIQKSLGRSLQAFAEVQRQMKPQMDAFDELRRILPPESVLVDMRAFAALQQQMKPQMDALAEFRRILPPESVMVEAQKLAAAMQAARAGYRRTIPDNLLPLEVEAVFAALELMSQADGVVLVWVPPTEVVKQLLAASTMALRDGVLTAQCANIVDGARAALNDVKPTGCNPSSAP